MSTSDGRAMAVVWLSAIVLSTVGMTILIQLTPATGQMFPGDSERLEPPPFGIFVGTSLVRSALPPELPANECFRAAGPSDLLVRGASLGTLELLSLVRVRHAVNAGTKEIFIELDPLLRTFPQSPVAASLETIREFSDRLRSAARYWRGRRAVATDVNTVALLDTAGAGIYDGKDVGELARRYPGSVHPPNDPAAISELLAIARIKRLNVVWVAMPRSQTAAAYLGRGWENTFAKQLHAFAAVFNATVWRPTIFWPNEFFVDSAHLNDAGRARFISELCRYTKTVDDF